MKNLLKWEFKQTFKSKTFLGFLAIFILGTIIFTLTAFFDGGKTGYELFLENCSNVNSIMILIIGVYSGIHVAGAFEERKLQAAVMAGNSRFSILMAKLLSFSLSIFIYTISSIAISSIIGFLITNSAGVEGEVFKVIILRTLAFSLVEVSFVSICFLLAMIVKNLGATITVNLIAMIALNSIGESLLTKTWALGFMKFTPVGQVFLTIIDAGTKNLLISVIASIIGLAFTITLSYIIFRKEELK